MKSDPLTKSDLITNLKRGFFWLYLLLALMVIEVLLITQTNTPRTMPVFLFLLILLVGLSLELGRSRALLVWLAAMFAWIVIKRSLGVWSVDTLVDNLLETILLLALAWAGGSYRDHQAASWNNFAEKNLRLQSLDLEDQGFGLLRPSVARLRLDEEEERAFHYQRPLGLLLFQVQSASPEPWVPREWRMVLKAVAAALKDVARDTDIPFHVEGDCMGLILPETDADGMQSLLDRLIANLQELRYVQASGESRPVYGQAQVRYGYAIFLGDSADRPDMLAAAQQSLERSVAYNQSPVFQNLFIEFQLLGRIPAQKPPVLGVSHE